jgi:hypothetical protein
MSSTTESLNESVDFVVDRSDLHRCQFVAARRAERLDAGQVLLGVDAFAFTANNITYAVAGDMLSYWSFFPAAPGWGRIPVWGFADVLRSSHPRVAEGARVFGYLPMSTHLVIQVDVGGPGGFADAAPHRAALPPIYNQYVLTANDPGYERTHEDQQMLFRPLFMTAFLLDDFIADNAFFGACRVVLSSASSKTAFGLAFLLSARGRSHCEVVGLTSAANRAFVEGLGCYHRVVTYDQIGNLPLEPVVFVDMAGDGTLTRALHHHYGNAMKHSCIVGMTHWEQRAQPMDLPGPTPTFFFAPTQLQKRTQELGAEGFQGLYRRAWREFVDFTRDRIRIVHSDGPAAVERVYRQTLDGHARPAEGHILSLRAPHGSTS